MESVNSPPTSRRRRARKRPTGPWVSPASLCFLCSSSSHAARNSGRHRARPVDISLGNVWAATRRNTWRLAMGPLVCLILLVIPGLITLHLGTMNRLSAAVVLTLLDLISIIAGVIGVSFLSLAYKHFFPTKPRFLFRAGMLVPIPASKLAAARSVIPVAASP